MDEECPWLGLMLADLGVHEVSGPVSNPVILQRFQDVGHPECQSDAIAWCAAEAGSCLVRSDFPLPPKDQRLMARSYCTYCIPCEPKRGAIVVWPRGNSTWQGHVGFVTEVNGDRVKYIAGNQSDQVGFGSGKISDALAFRWPIKPTIPELRKAGSTEIKAADAVQAATVAGGAATAGVEAAKQLLPAPEDLTGELSTIKQIGQSINEIGELAGKHWYVALVIIGVGIWYAARRWKLRRARRAALGLPLSQQVDHA